jgi:hypothetical protein
MLYSETNKGYEMVYVPNHFSSQYEMIKKGLEAGETFDFNSLPTAGKPAAITLRDHYYARITIKDGRVVVEPSFFLRHPFLNVVVSFATVGIVGIIH